MYGGIVLVAVTLGSLRNITVYVLALAGALALVGDGFAHWATVARRAARVRLIDGRYCGRCRYDLTGNTSGVCPECGRHVGPLPRRRRRPYGM